MATILDTIYTLHLFGKDTKLETTIINLHEDVDISKITKTIEIGSDSITMYDQLTTCALYHDGYDKETYDKVFTMSVMFYDISDDRKTITFDLSPYKYTNIVQDNQQPSIGGYGNYSIDIIDRPFTVNELRRILSIYEDDDALIYDLSTGNPIYGYATSMIKSEKKIIIGLIHR